MAYLKFGILASEASCNLYFAWILLLSGNRMFYLALDIKKPFMNSFFWKAFGWSYLYKFGIGLLTKYMNFMPMNVEELGMGAWFPIISSVLLIQRCIFVILNGFSSWKRGENINKYERHIDNCGYITTYPYQITSSRPNTSYAILSLEAGEANVTTYCSTVMCTMTFFSRLGFIYSLSYFISDLINRCLSLPCSPCFFLVNHKVDKSYRNYNL